jgi:N-acetylglucosaminyldiphosphoundecaprenol N-acetyl-beta-D-mannosaminyltransferase
MKRKILFKKINFSNGEFEEIYNKVKKGGLVVAPAASALVEIENDKIYHNSLINSDVVLLDSGFFCILLRIFRNQEVKKLSGYKFLKKFLNKNKFKNKNLLMIDPTKEESHFNQNFLKLKKFKKIYSYTAPFYDDNKNFHKDKNLINYIKKIKPDCIIINLAGGKQEPLGIFLKNYLTKNVLIICTGAAIAFLTKRQAPINDLIDKFYLGWALRIIFNPKNTYKRFLKSFKLINYFF